MLATLLAFAMLIYIAVRRPQAAPAPRVEEEDEDDLSDDLIALPDPISEPGGHRVEPGGHRGPTPLAPMSGAFFCLLYTSPSPRDATLSRMPSSA